MHEAQPQLEISIFDSTIIDTDYSLTFNQTNVVSFVYLIFKMVISIHSLRLF